MFNDYYPLELFQWASEHDIFRNAFLCLFESIFVSLITKKIEYLLTQYFECVNDFLRLQCPHLADIVSGVLWLDILQFKTVSASSQPRYTRQAWRSSCRRLQKSDTRIRRHLHRTSSQNCYASLPSQNVAACNKYSVLAILLLLLRPWFTIVGM